MINKKQIAEMAQKILKQSRGLRDHKMMHPEREWLIGVGIALGIFTVAAYGSIYTYWKDKHMTSSIEAAASEDSVTYRASIVKEALERFEKRNKEREELMSSFSGEQEAAETVIETSSTSVPVASSTTPLETASSTERN